jgi:hypothetical protein
MVPPFGLPFAVFCLAIFPDQPSKQARTAFGKTNTIYAIILVELAKEFW